MGSIVPPALPDGLAARHAARDNTILSTSGVAPGYLQANLIVLPSRYASDFRLLCKRNPVPCPLLAESADVGSFDKLKSWVSGVAGENVAKGIDIRKDAPRFMVYRDSKLVKSKCEDIVEEWSDDHVAFLIGCSYSFETALEQAGLPPRHMVLGRVVPMYRTNIRLCPAGAFTGGTYVVSMRPYKKADIETVRDVTRPYVTTHGEPVAWGWDAVKALGIETINNVDWGEPPVTADGEPLTEGDEENVPVFFGCGVTPQEAVMRADLSGTIMGHAPGHMIVLDIKDDDVIQKS
ncbi:DUF1445 domain-containing protein [Phyllosticta capitalensis]|uniref:DUF1445 domain-containing protein n=1 Tax=Phyllosticta capitalensis TaxID=121624 RepID=UPI0031316A6C